VSDLATHGSILLLPAAGAASHANYLATVAQPVDPGVISEVYDNDAATEDAYDLLADGKLAVWGFRNNNKLRTDQETPILWDRIDVGTLALFSDSTHYHTSARVIGKGRQPRVSQQLWGDPDFPWILFLTDVREMDISLDAVKEAAGYAENYNINRQAIVPKAEREPDLWRLISLDVEGGGSGHRVWWVNQGSTWEAERQGNFLWAPTQTQDGRKQGHWESMKEVQHGDRVIHYANGTIRAVSTVASEYELAERPSELEDAWESSGYFVASEYQDITPSVPLASIELATRLLSSSGPFNQHGGVKQGYLFPIDDEQAQRIAADVPAIGDLLGLDGSAPQTRDGVAIVLQPQYTLEWLVQETNWEETRLEELVGAITGDSPQIVLAGPPGTSKTWVAKHLITYLTQGDPGRSRTVQFHPTYGYEEFIEGLRPVVDHGEIKFDRVDGLILAYVKEIAHETEPSFVLIDEMNRANLARVFGELMYLFEYRDEPIDLRYTRGWELPANLKFLGTMNTADRSIRSIDIALRRRFDVFECPPDASVLERFYSSGASVYEVHDLVAGFIELNVQLEAALDKHHTIGHAFFMHAHLTPDRLRAVWTRKIGPLLEEYFFDQEDLAAGFSLARFWPDVVDAE
jgi:hypothetical protein